MTAAQFWPGDLDSPSGYIRPVTPDDSTDLADGFARGVYVGGGGNLRVTDLTGTVVTIANLQAGAYYPFRVRRIHATSTTATDIFALY